MLEVATICVQTGLNLARHILESPCQYVRCQCLNFYGDVCFLGVYGSWFVLVNSPFQISPEEIIRCGMSRRRIIGPIFFDATITTAAYMEIFNTFVNQLDDEGTLNWIFPAGWSDIPHFTRQHGRNSVLFRRPRHFEGSLATALTRSDAAWLFLMGISERESLPKQTTNHRRLESKHHRRNSGSDSGRTGKDFPKYGAPGSILSGRKWWPLPAHVMMPSHFLHSEVSPLQILLQYPH